MAQDLSSLLSTLQNLNRLAQEGKLPREQLQAEVTKMTAAVKDVLANLHEQLPPEAVGASSVLVDLFKSQIGALLQHSGLDIEESEEMKKLSEELEMIKRSYIRS